VSVFPSTQAELLIEPNTDPITAGSANQGIIRAGTRHPVSRAVANPAVKRLQPRRNLSTEHRQYRPAHHICAKSFLYRDKFLQPPRIRNFVVINKCDEICCLCCMHRTITCLGDAPARLVLVQQRPAEERTPLSAHRFAGPQDVVVHDNDKNSGLDATSECQPMKTG
jgi:hypothetical protein